MDTPFKELVIPKTPKTPLVNLNHQTGEFRFTGRSIPENAVEFYRPVVEWIKGCGSAEPQAINVRVQMEYLNTSSAKCILDVFKALGTVHQSGVPVEVDWVYADDDEDMLEMGEDYQSILDLPFNLISEPI